MTKKYMTPIPFGRSNQSRSRTLASLWVLFFCVMNGIAESRPMARPASEVVDIKHSELVGEFVKAHTKAGFTVKEKFFEKENGTTTLTFIYLPAGRPYKIRGEAQYYISGGNTCPCKIYIVIAGPVAIEDDSFRREIEAHLDEARTYLVEKLKSKYHKLEYSPVPPGVPQ